MVTLCLIYQHSNVESAKSEIDALAEAENGLIIIERDLEEAERVHFFDHLVHSHFLLLLL